MVHSLRHVCLEYLVSWVLKGGRQVIGREMEWRNDVDEKKWPLEYILELSVIQHCSPIH